MTCTFVICSKEKPWLVLFSGGLDAVAEAFAAQPDPESLEVYAADAGHSRPLNAAEEARFPANRL